MPRFERLISAISNDATALSRRKIPLAVTLAVMFTLVVSSGVKTVLADSEEHDMKAEWERGSYEPYPFPYFVDDTDRYPGATPPAGTVNRHGEVEYIGNGVFGVHWFVKTDDPVWHFVTAGDPSDDVVVLVHGYPDTWYAYSKVMALLAEDYYVVAVDTLGYGQSDKRPVVDVSYAAVAKNLTLLLDKIGIRRFHLVSHDRGSVISDHLIANRPLSRRIQTFLRMQQSFDQPHGLPQPPHAAMATVEFQSDPNLIRDMYASNYVSVELPEEEIARLEWEWGFAGTAEASARTFMGTSFDIEREFRMQNTVQNMTMPVVFLQGDDDPGQHPEEYYRSASLVPNGRVIIVDQNHFIHTENPELVAQIARELFNQ
ncbi:MAG: alpha/beta hydrolase [Pseudomonadota bacterium]